MKKNKTLVIIICSILVVLILFNIPQIWNSCFVMKRNDIEAYINNEYINYNHGEIAKSFFDDFSAYFLPKKRKN